MVIRNFEDLIVWQRAMDFAEHIYRLTTRFPRDERFGMTSQLRRAATSVPTNIAEGSGRYTTGELKNALSNSRGSLKESESLLILSGRVGFIERVDVADARDRTDEISRMLTGLRKKL